MKFLKITFLLLAVVALVLSGTNSSDIKDNTDNTEVKEYKKGSPIAHTRDKVIMSGQG